MKKREQWSSNFGFLMAAAGSAVGLGNLWKFPYLAGNNGGAIFLIFYFVLLVLLGMPILLSEMAIGRSTHLNAIDACKKINPKWGFVGVIGILGAFIILSYYSIIGGWVLKYIFSYIFEGNIENPTDYFIAFSSSSVEPIVWHLLFMAICVIIVMGGISKGIERVSKIFLPLLLVFIIFIAINSLLLPNAIEGVKFFLVPDFSQINEFSDIATIFLHAMGQVFFSLSLGMGTLITYGSYLDKNSNLQKNAVIIPLIDTSIAILAGFAILPAVFSFGMTPNAGPGLIFQALPNVFSQIKGGRFLAIIFFVLVFFAAVTSAISLLEVVASYFIDNKKWKRPIAVTIPACGMTLVGVFASLSFGSLENIKIFGMTFFDFLTFLSDKILMPIGGLFMCILVGYIWGMKHLKEEISSDGKYKTPVMGTLSVILKFIAPLMIFIILLTSLFNF